MPSASDSYVGYPAIPLEILRNMKTLKSYACGEWYEADSGFVALHDPSTEEEIARASAEGLDRAAALEFVGVGLLTYYVLISPFAVGQ